VSLWHTIEKSGISITNVYRPPPAPFSVHTLPLPPDCDTVIVAGDFNCHHTSWGYSASDENGEALLVAAASLLIANRGRASPQKFEKRALTIFGLEPEPYESAHQLDCSFLLPTATANGTAS